jgi:HEAT repeat protein
VLGKLGDPRALTPLNDLKKDPFMDVRNAADAAIRRIRK